MKYNLLSEDVVFDRSVGSSLVLASVPAWHLPLPFCTGTPFPHQQLLISAMLILIFLFQTKVVNQIFERKLSAGYLYAVPRQKCRFKETAICKHEGSRCYTIKGNLKERGKVIEGQNESEVKNFSVVATNTKMMFYIAPSSPMLKTPVVFWVTATKCHLSLYRRCNFRAVLLFLTLNREFILHIFPFIFQPLWKIENSLLLSHEGSWQIQCKEITPPRLAVEANRSQPCCNLSSTQFNPRICFLLLLKSMSTISHVLWRMILQRSLRWCLCAPWLAAGTSLLPPAPVNAALPQTQCWRWLSHERPCSRAGAREKAQRTGNCCALLALAWKKQRQV